MTRLDRMRRACAAFVVAGFVMPVAVAAPAPKGQGPKAPVPAAAQPPPAVVALGRLHHVAQREIALGLMAQVAAFRPETVRFATDLETDFRVLDRHIVAIADAHGIGEERLRQAYADDNTLALDGQTDDLDRLSMVRGKDFDREFWVTVARDQRAASVLVAAVAGTVPSLDPLVAETTRLLDRFIRRASAAQTGAGAPPPR
jgi:Domain of unknown function (DUF4142)